MTTETIIHAEVSTTILERIQKLLALAESPNTNEAANAAAKVQELLDIYNLEMSQVLAHQNENFPKGATFSATEIRHTYGPQTSALNKAWQWLMGMLSKQNNCSVLLVYGHERATDAEKKKSKTVAQSGYKRVARFAVIGEKTNAEATIALFDWLKVQLEAEAAREWPLYREDMLDANLLPGDPIPFRINFIQGATLEIGRIMNERRKESENFEAITALAVNHKQANDDFISDLYGKLGKPSGQSKSRGNGYAYARGKVAGARVERSRHGTLTGNSQKAIQE